MIAPVLADRDVTDIVQDPEFLWLVGALVATLIVGAIMISWIERWRKRQLSDSPKADVEQISTYRAMFERGDLSKEEYDRIKQKEAHRLRDKLTAQATKRSSAGPEPPAQPSPQEPESPPPPA